MQAAGFRRVRVVEHVLRRTVRRRDSDFVGKRGNRTEKGETRFESGEIRVGAHADADFGGWGWSGPASYGVWGRILCLGHDSRTYSPRCRVLLQISPGGEFTRCALYEDAVVETDVVIRDHQSFPLGISCDAMPTPFKRSSTNYASPGLQSSRLAIRGQIKEGEDKYVELIFS